MSEEKYYCNDNDIENKPMTKDEAEASVREMENMMDWFEGICEKCGEQRKNCSMECLDKED